MLFTKKGRLITARHNYLKFELINLLEDISLESYIKIELLLPYSAKLNNYNRLVRDISAKK